MSRIKKCFETLKAGYRKALVAFITAGDPDLDGTRGIFEVIEKSGADIIEQNLRMESGGTTSPS